MTELASVLSVLVGVLAIGVALATVTLTALYRMERRIDQRFSQFETYTNQRFDQIDQRFDQVDQRFDQVDRISTRLTGVSIISQSASPNSKPGWPVSKVSST